MAIPTPHIEAKLGDFADTVLMPGDPMRAKFIAERYLENAVLVNRIRGINGYTGYYKGKRVSVMASGIGMPSIALYSYELFNFYNVKSIIRIGTCGTFNKELELNDIIIAMGACTNSNYAMQYNLPGTFCPIADFELVKKAVELCKNSKVNYKVGNVFSTDTFYDDTYPGLEWAKMGVLGVEMESAALYCNAARLGKKALCICTVTDSFINPNEKMSAKDRERSLTKMIEIALELA